MKIRFVLTRDENIPTGGVRQAYRHVDILNDNGYDAAIVAPRPGFRCSWFENKTRIVGPDEVVGPGDFLVLSEVLPCVPEIEGADKANIVIFAQNPFSLFRGYGGLPRLFDFYENRVKGVMCVSKHSLEVIGTLLPEVDIHRIWYSFDKPPFGMPSKRKERLIVYMSRRRKEDIEMALMIAGGRKALRGWRVESICDKTEEEVADLMRRAAVFVAGGQLEGFGMPAAEAMACGCVVVGWHGHGGREFMLPGISYPIPEGDYITCANTLVELLNMDFEELLEVGKMASDYIRSTYPTKKEVNSIKRAWESMTEAPPRMKDVAAFVSTYDEGPYLKAVLKFLSPKVGRVYVVESESTFHGAQKPEGERRTKRIVDEVVQEGASNIVYHVLEGQEHPSPDIKEANERNQALEMIERDGFEWVWIVDADELYTEADANGLWKWFFKTVEDNPDVLGAKCSWYTYWRSVHWRIDPPEPFRPNVIIRSSCRILSSRHLLPKQQSKIVDAPFMVHHYSWAHTPEHVQRKISTWTHAHQVKQGWFDDVFLAWRPGCDMENVHPTKPEAYKRVVSAEGDMPEALEGHPYLGQQVIGERCEELSGKRIKVVILNHNSPENCDKLYETLEPYFDVEIFDSGSDPYKIPIHIGRALENVYWAGGWNEILRTCRDYDAVWMLGCDITLKQDPSDYRRAIETSLPFGCWSPCIEGRAKPFMQASNYVHGEPRMVRNIEGMALAVSREFMQEVTDLPEGSDGYGQDLWMCMRARQMGLPNIIDGRVCVHHPEGTGYSDKKFHNQMEKVFGDMFGPDFRRTAFEYDDRYDYNLTGSHEATVEERTQKPDTHRFTIVTVDNGWGYPDFKRMVSNFPDARKIVMTKGIVEIPEDDGVELVPYDPALSTFLAEADVAFFAKVGVSTRKDMLSLMRAGIPCVVHQNYGSDVEHMQNGFVYQSPDWAIQWVTNIRDDPKYKEAVENYQWTDDKPEQELVQNEVQEPNQKTLSLVGVSDVPCSLVTVITPTWNRDPAIVKRCIDSIRLQTEDSWVQLVCSNGPEEPLIKDLVVSIGDDRVRYCHLNIEPQKGDFGNSSRFASIRAAQSKYVMFCDDDNIVMPTFIEDMCKAIQVDEKYDFAICDIMHFGPLNEQETGMRPPVVLKGEPVKLYYVDPLQVFVKTKVMQESGWDTEVGYLSDGVSIERMAKGREYVRVPKVLGIHL